MPVVTRTKARNSKQHDSNGRPAKRSKFQIFHRSPLVTTPLALQPPPPVSKDTPGPSAHLPQDHREDPQVAQDLKLHPQGAQDPETDYQGAQDPEPDPQGAQDPVPDPQDAQDPEPDPQDAQVPKPDPQDAQDPEPDPQDAQVPKPDPQDAQNPGPDPQGAQDPVPDPQDAQDPEPDPQDAQDPKPDPQDAQDPEPDPQGTQDPEPDPQGAQDLVPDPQDAQDHEPEPQGTQYIELHLQVAQDSKLDPQVAQDPELDPQGAQDPEDPQDPEDTQAFRCVPSLLKVCSGHRAHRYPVSVEEVKRRTAPPEMMSVNTLTSLLRINKNEKRNLKEELKKVGVVPGPVTQVTSLCTRLTEGEAKDLCQSVGVLAAKGINFEAVTMPITTDPIVAIGKAAELKYQLQNLAQEVQRNGQDFHNLSHGLGPGMVDVVVEILSKCIDDNIKKMQS